MHKGSKLVIMLVNAVKYSAEWVYALETWAYHRPLLCMDADLT